MEKEMVSLEDAIEQVKKTSVRIALLHLGFSKILVEELGEEKAEELIVKSIVEYGKNVDKLQKHDNLPYYGLYDKQSYKDREYVDARKLTLDKDEVFDFKHLKVHGCVLAKTFKELNEERLGALYCYVDAARSMAANINNKLIHSDCVLCGDDCCSFQYLPTSEQEKENFRNNNKDWETVDPLLFEKKKI